MVQIPIKAKIRRGNSGKHPNYVITVPAAFVHSGALEVGEEYELLIQSRRKPVTVLEASHAPTRNSTPSDTLQDGTRVLVALMQSDDHIPIIALSVVESEPVEEELSPL